MAQDFGDDMGNALLNFVTRQTENYLRFGRGRERAFDWWQRHYKKEGNTPEQAKAMAEKQSSREQVVVPFGTSEEAAYYAQVCRENGTYAAAYTDKQGNGFLAFAREDAETVAGYADDGRNAAQSTVCKAFAATFDPKDPEGLVLYGKRGTGKSFHASCIANAVIERGFSCLVTDIKQVVNLMESSFEKRSGNLERILAPDLLILEDLGAQRSTEYVMEHVYDVIDGRYKAGKPMVITTNFDFRERILNATADDPWGRVFDRIVEVGFPVKYDGNSRRREIGMKNRKDFKRKLGIEGIES